MNIQENDRIYNLSSYKKRYVKDIGTYYTYELKDNIKELIDKGDVCWCGKTTKKSAEALFEMFGIDLVDGKIIKIDRQKIPISVNHTPPSIENNPEEKRGVKKGETRGKKEEYFELLKQGFISPTEFKELVKALKL